MASMTKRRKRDKTTGAWLVHMVENQTAVRGGHGFEPHTGPIFSVLK